MSRPSPAKFLISTLLCVLVWAGECAAALPTLNDKLDQYLSAAESVLKFSGVALVAQDGKIVFAKAYGMADRQKNVANSLDTKFLIGSITKQFTATAIMQQVAAGKIKLDEPVTKYLPDYPKATGDKITIRNLLNHTSGIQNFTDLPAYAPNRSKPTTPADVVNQFKNLPLDFEPGTRYNYSNSGYILLGVILEKVSGEPYARYLKRHIFDPAGMTHTGYMDYSVTPMAVGYEPDSTGQMIPSIKVDPSIPFSAGGLYSTAGDLLLWDQALYGKKILSRHSLQEMWTPKLENYGFGWIIDTIYGHRRVWHDGAIDGFMSGFQRFVDDRTCILILSNNGGVPEGLLSLSLAAIVFHQPYAIPVIKKPIAIKSDRLADYVGVYEIAPNVYRLITRDGDSLFAQRTGTAVRLLQPESDDKFYYDYDNSVTIEFSRNDSGRVSSQTVCQNGQFSLAKKITGPVADSLLATVTESQISEGEMDRLVGSYQLTPEMVLEVRRKGNAMFTQATGQPECEIFPRSNTEFFVKVVDARLTFVKDSTGRVTGLVLHQAGKDLPAPKIK